MGGAFFVGNLFIDVHKLTLIAPLTVDDFSWGTTRQVAQSRSLTRQKGVRNLDIDKSDTEMTILTDFSDEELKLDDELKQIFGVPEASSSKKNNSSMTSTISSMSSDMNRGMAIE